MTSPDSISRPAGPVEPVIHISGAREHNLRNLDVRIPRGRLVVITGVSGSGKSSLAFDTLYAEGYRKYMESLSTHARQLLSQLPRPDVDFIHGLSPVLAIEQRTGGASPRSTVATVTEVADYARLLWAVAGEAYCPKDGGRIVRRTLDDSVDQVLGAAAGRRIMVLAPFMAAKSSVLRDELPRLRQRGFQRVRIDGEVRSLDESNLIPGGTGEVVVEVVVDRLAANPDQRSRLADSVELAFREGGSRALVLMEAGSGEWAEIPLSQHLACEVCGEVHEPLTPRHFSFNHREGACPECGGLGRKLRYAADLVVPDPSKTVRGGALKPMRIGGKSTVIRHNALLKQLAEQLPFDADVPWSDVPAEVRQSILHGAGDRVFTFRLRRGSATEARAWPGVFALLEENARASRSDGYRARLARFQESGPCPLCEGRRLHPRSLAVRLQGKNPAEFFSLSLVDAHAFASSLPMPEAPGPVREVLAGIRERLRFMLELGLGYLTLEREYGTLSGGEAQRVRLATQLGMGLTGVIYVLDEPSVGLHPVDNGRLIETLRGMRDRGNTVVVVEHDEDMMRAADHLIELGPGAGTEGGRLVFAGSPADCAERSSRESATGGFLSGRSAIVRDAVRRTPDDAWLTVRNAAEHNLRNLTVRIPVGLLTCVTGVSGSGKSTLINDILAPAALRRLNRASALPGLHEGIDGLDRFEKAVVVDQSPIGRSPRSNPATYVKLFDLLRDLFAQCPLARIRGYRPSRFSFNVRGGRCERCQGDGQIRLDMQFLADAYAICPSCGGRRYNRETLEVRFHGYSIADVLNLTVREAAELFRFHPKVMDKLRTLDAVGLAYLKLGQPANTLSGGEAQRLKLSLELSRRQQGGVLYLLDEPTTGLHWVDIQKLMDLLFQLRDARNTVLIIEHHLDVIKMADWVIDLGPGGGVDGGELIAEGRPEAIAACEGSATGTALRAVMTKSE